MTAFDVSTTADGVLLTVRPERTGLLGRLFGRGGGAVDLDNLPPSERDLLLALADVRAAGEADPSAVEIAADHVRLSHRAVASLAGETAERLGLPPLVDLTLRTDVEGVIGSASFRLRTEWVKGGQRQFPKRVGAILETAAGPRRLPLWMLEAIEVAEAYRPDGDDAAQWAALARFRQALDPGVTVAGPTAAARVSMTDFLAGLEVRVADSFAIAPNEALDDFDVVPFDGRHMREDGDGGIVGAADGELAGRDLGAFQARVRERGALPAYRLGQGNYLVVDRGAAPALTVMAEMMRSASREDRKAFIRNPRPRITEAVVEALKARGDLDGLSPVAEEEAIESAAGSLFVETREFSERVVGLKVYEKTIAPVEASGTTWLPEVFARQLAETLAAMAAPELREIRDRVAGAIETGEATVDVAGHDLPAGAPTLELVETHLKRVEEREAEAADDDTDEAAVAAGPIVLETIVNFEDLRWEAKLVPRTAVVPTDLPATIRTPLKDHQSESFAWQVEAWKAGLPGILNADEQGSARRCRPSPSWSG